MLRTFESLLTPAVMERLTLVINHVLRAEPVACERLRPHVGRTVELVAIGWPALLPVPPRCVMRVTPAGLVEWCGLEAPAADLTLRIDASDPALLLARALAAEPPPVVIEGDAQLAGDVDWLMQNLRWDVAADLERLFGSIAAAQLERFGRALAAAVRAALQGIDQLRGRLHKA